MAGETTRDQHGFGVRADIGKTAAEGQAAGDAANAAFNAAFNETSNRAQPGNGKPFYPDAATDTDANTDGGKKFQVPGKI